MVELQSVIRVDKVLSGYAFGPVLGCDEVWELLPAFPFFPRCVEDRAHSYQACNLNGNREDLLVFQVFLCSEGPGNRRAHLREIHGDRRRVAREDLAKKNFASNPVNACNKPCNHSGDRDRL